MRGVYLAARSARHENYDIKYNDIDPRFKPDILGDMLEVDLAPFDFVIATAALQLLEQSQPLLQALGIRAKNWPPAGSRS